MCVTCGCSDTDSVTISGPMTDEERAANAAHDHAHAHALAHVHNTRTLLSPVAPHDHEREFVYTKPPTQTGLNFDGRIHAHEHAHPHDTSPAHDHSAGISAQHTALHSQLQPTTIALEQNILAKNQLLAERNRGWFAGRSIIALNLVSSPGSGKTTLLERTIRDLKDQLPISVIEGDQATLNDAERIRATGAPAIQINTGTGCHLEADMLARGLAQLNPPPGSVVMIENVGNLVCPALFDLGEQAKIVILSVTEGEDKPLKYPHMFKASSVMLLNKIDLLPYLKFDVEKCIAYAHQVNPDILVLQVSAQSGEGMDAWYDWLRSQLMDGHKPV